MTRRPPARATALIAGLAFALAAVVVGTGPAAAGEPSAPDVAANIQVAGPGGLASADITGIQTDQESITIDDLRQLVTQFEAAGDVTFAGARRLEFLLEAAEHYVEFGLPSLAVTLLEEFKEVVSNPRYVPSESAQDELTAAADELIAQLSATP